MGDVLADFALGPVHPGGGVDGGLGALVADLALFVSTFTFPGFAWGADSALPLAKDPLPAPLGLGVDGTESTPEGERSLVLRSNI